MRGVALPVVSSFLLIVSFPRFDFEFLAWFALVPLFLSLKDKGLKSAFGLSFLTAILFFMGVFYWINIVPGVKWTNFLLLGLYLGSYFGLFGVVLNFVSQKTTIPVVLTAPLVWVSVEYLRSHAGFLGLPWALLGHSQYLNVPTIQISSLTGVYGVSFLIVMVNVALSELLLSRTAAKRENLLHSRSWAGKSAIVTILVLGVSLGYGFSVLSEKPEGNRTAISVIQPSIPQHLKWRPELRKLHLEKHARLSREAAKNGSASVIVWPEASVQGFFTQDFYLSNTLIALAKQLGTHLLIGTSQRPKFGSGEFKRLNWFNSALLISPSGGVAGQYHKIHLLPFGEYLPYKEVFPWPSRLVSEQSVIPGKEFTIFNAGGAKFGVLICWESIFADLFRQFPRRGANFIVNITNEAWFGDTAAPYQFMAMNVFRAVENRISIARSANTGISGFIDPYGRIIGKVQDGSKDIFVEGYLTKEIPLSEQRTFYTIYGDLFAYANLIMTSFFLALSFWKCKGTVKQDSWVMPRE